MSTQIDVPRWIIRRDLNNVLSVQDMCLNLVALDSCYSKRACV